MRLFIGSDKAKIMKLIEHAMATLVYGIDNVHKNIQKIIIIKKICFKFIFDKFSLKNGNKVNGDNESIDTIMSFGPIKFNVLVKINGIEVKSCNLFNM